MYPLNNSGVDSGKESEQRKVGVDVTVVIDLQNSLCGKWKTVDIIPCYRRRGVMQHHMLMAIPAYN